MLTLALLGLLAVASPADTAVRVPGTTLRFGLNDAAITARGFAVAGPGERKGRCRFFGLTSDATLTLEDGRLARAEFAVNGASTYEIAYIHDQLTAMGYRKSCGQPTPKTEVCDWTARTHIRVERSGTNLKASVVRAGVGAAAPATARATAPDTGFNTAQRVIARLKGRTAPAGTTARDTARDAIPGAGAAPVPPGTPALSRPARTSLPRDTVPAPAVRPVPVLPETLAVDLPGRASRYTQATLLGDPRCDYPAAAREAGIQGRVWVFALVDIDGRVIRTRLKSGIPVLNATALECVKGWNFKPVAWQGAPCRYWVLVPVTVTLD